MTVTNDGWFWGSSLLDIHLACGAFRAIEMRLPLLIAANTGFSAWIDSNGRVRSQGPRRQEGIVVAHVNPVARPSLYLTWGDWFAGLCLLTVGAAWAGQVFLAVRRSFRETGRIPANGPPDAGSP